MLPCYYGTTIFLKTYFFYSEKALSHNQYEFKYCNPITVYSCYMTFLMRCGIFRMRDVECLLGCGMLVYKMPQIKYLEHQNEETKRASYFLPNVPIS